VTFQKYVTERKQAQEALRRSQDYLAQAQGLSHTGSGAWNAVTREVVWSDETYRIYGVDRETATPPSELFWTLVHPEDRLFVEQAFERVVLERSNYELEFRVVRPDGTIRHVHSVGRPVLTEAGNLKEVIGTVMDVTERRRVEEALQKSRDELAHIARIATFGELTALVAHEVSQPLASIVADSSAALRWLSRDAPDLDEARRAVERIVREANRAGDVIKQLRALTGKVGVRLDSLQVNEPIQEMVSLVQYELTRKRIALRWALASPLPPVLGDRVQLAQVILNLMMNAIEAMAGVTDRPREMVLGTQLCESDKVLVSVCDSGAGFGPQVLERIFDSFVTTKPEGMGLGLSISRTIIEHHGGRLWATPNPQHGATLFFTLPVAPGSAAPAASTPQE
jgi:PAS domain S-box-containing protein